MGLASDIRKKMDRKRKELTELRSRRDQIQSSLRETNTLIREVNAALAAYEEVLRLAPDDSDDETSEPRPGSMVALAREALRKHGQPLHVGKLLEAMGKQPTSSQKVSLGSSLAAYVRKEQIFTKPEANTFGLREWQKPSEESPTEKEVAEALEQVK